MAFSDFHYPEVLQQLGLSWRTDADLFGSVAESPPGQAFRDTLAVGARLAGTINTEKARSEWMVAPILGEFWWRYRGQISLFSGVDFQADPVAGLNGYCDFLIGRAPQQPDIQAPVVVIFEAKRENLNDGLGQCIAGMEGVARYNRRRNTPTDPIYGCVTTGTAWKFLRDVRPERVRAAPDRQAARHPDAHGRPGPAVCGGVIGHAPGSPLPGIRSMTQCPRAGSRRQE